MTLSPNIQKFKSNIPFWLSLILFITSLTQTAYVTDYYDKDTSEASSIMEFLVGWTGIFYMPYGIPWLANPLLMLSWRFSLKGRIAKAVFLSVLSSIFAGSFLLFHKMPANEAPTYANIITIELGYWLWLTSCLVFSFGTSIVFLIKKAQKTA